MALSYTWADGYTSTTLLSNGELALFHPFGEWAVAFGYHRQR
jgi:hypothetical protein